MEKLYERWIKYDEATLGPDRRELVPLLTILAGLYERRRHHAGAREASERAVRILDAHGAGAAELGPVLSLLAAAYRGEGRCADGAAVVERAATLAPQPGSDPAEVARQWRRQCEAGSAPAAASEATP
jgi:hypothetical protein